MGDLFETPDVHEKMRGGKPTAVWKIRDSAGVLHAEHFRYDRGRQKHYLWRLPGASRWGLAGRKVGSLPLYRSERVACWPEDVPVVITEGEPAAAALAGLYPATLGTVTGAHSTPGPEALDVLRGRNVVLWADNDEPGREHMCRIATALQGIAKTVRIYEWPGATFPGADAANHPVVASRSGFEALLDEWCAAPVWSPETATEEPVGTLVEDVAPERVSWLWRGRIPLGKITLIDGDPGTGKSALATDLAARVSVGRKFPDGTPCRAGGVVIASAEDGLADTIRPRLDAAGADLSRVLALATVPDGDTERLISVPEDIGVIRRGIEQVQARLVVIDPLMAFLSGDVNSHRDQDVRRALAPLAKLAEETGAALVVVRHLNKSSDGNALYRGGGSIGIVGQARSALLVARHPEDDRRRVLASLKSNLAEPAPSLAFTFTEAANGAVRVE